MKLGFGANTKKLLIIYAFYVIGITLIPFLLGSVGLMSTPIRTFKELFFAVWGYGWDGMHYIEIAQRGYKFPNQAFFPLYPLLLKTLNFILPLTLSYRVNLLLLPAFLFCSIKLMDQYSFDYKQKLKAVIVFLLFPSSFILQSNYTETLFILLSILTFLFLFKEKFLYASLFSALATATRFNGIILSLIIVYSFTKHHRAQLKRVTTFFKTLLLFSISNLGLIIYLLYLNTFQKTYTVLFRAQGEWGRSQNILQNMVSVPLKLIPDTINSARHLDPWFTRELIQNSIFILALILLVVSFKKLKTELYLFSLAQVLLPLATGTLISFPRLFLLAFPLIFYGSKFLIKEEFFYAYAFLSTILQVILIVLFMNNRFIV
ncbi:MAG: mannosyltransferase family protein [Patescibacteria group bacterium]